MYQNCTKLYQNLFRRVSVLAFCRCTFGDIRGFYLGFYVAKLNMHLSLLPESLKLHKIVVFHSSMLTGLSTLIQVLEPIHLWLHLLYSWLVPSSNNHRLSSRKWNYHSEVFDLALQLLGYQPCWLDWRRQWHMWRMLELNVKEYGLSVVWEYFTQMRVSNVFTCYLITPMTNWPLDPYTCRCRAILWMAHVDL